MQDRKIILWNPNKGTQVKTYLGHGYEVRDVAVSADNNKFASCGKDKQVRASLLNTAWLLSSCMIHNTLQGSLFLDYCFRRGKGRRCRGLSGDIGHIRHGLCAPAMVLILAGLPLGCEHWKFHSQAERPRQHCECGEHAHAIFDESLVPNHVHFGIVDSPE
jgi:hypothetical protein